jgi:hypothetical protein
LYISRFIIYLACLYVSLPSGLLNAMPIAGWQETITIYLPSQTIQLAAKLDTGADTSSLHAEDIRLENDHNQQTWVHFRLAQQSYRLPLVRFAHIKRHQASAQRRPVVSIVWCLHQQRIESEFTLVNRQDFSTPALLGRAALAQRFLVDSATSHQLSLCN